MPEADWIVVGGGTAGCVLANRLSAGGARVVLFEAGRDLPPGQEPEEIRSNQPSVILRGTRYLWPRLVATVGAPGPDGRSPPPRLYEQARVLGGGSAVNAQLANRGLPRDYDEWARLGAAGWHWDGVLPYFRQLESDRDFDGPLHGRDGPVHVERVLPPAWSPFSRALARAFDAAGYARLDDQNAEFGDGYFANAYSTRDGVRVTAAGAYLDASVRRRANLLVRTDATVESLLFEGSAVVGVRVREGGVARPWRARRVVLTAGALHTPALLLRAGIGPGDELQALGIAVRASRPGVGRNLMEHPATALAAWVPPAWRSIGPAPRSGHVNLRFSSQVAGAPPSDLYAAFNSRAAWHGVGQRLAFCFVWLNKPDSRGRVRLRSPDPDAEPDVEFRLLEAPGDVARLASGVATVAACLAHEATTGAVRHPFPAAFSPRLRRASQIGARNRIVLGLAGRLLDGPGWLRETLLRRVITQGDALDALLADPALLASYLRRNVTGVWHACGTCRMGDPLDPATVTAPDGRVLGVDGLWVGDASLMPAIPSANTNLPTFMVAEKIAAGLVRAA